MYDKITKILDEVIKDFSVMDNPKKINNKLSEETKSICEKRNRLAAKNGRTSRENVELVELRKLARKRVRSDLRKAEEGTVKEIIESSGSTKKMKKELNEFRGLIPKMRNERGIQVYGREEIIDVATNFYSKLYDLEDKTTSKGGQEQKGTEEEFPPILKEEVLDVLSKVKADRATGGWGGDREQVSQNVRRRADPRLDSPLQSNR